ncbi:Tyrosine recombinase XerC [Fusobacterium necrogenes]|uniref:Tyrosine recombinase XerC n=1 Tax=Fusobacterium necrogenes TaxID=858 RepID=A0A377GUW2_9FUSO|nr:tyrosine-type recombinase/integrase [Fusobacterium necrogenes]STO30760.1 Tyrosine recombinase XerC [Fusobacterium necrogenes]
MKHRPHDCRHTFATLLSNANANATAIKKMIGHESYATTEKIYTHKDIEELRKKCRINKIINYVEIFTIFFKKMCNFPHFSIK